MPVSLDQSIRSDSLDFAAIASDMQGNIVKSHGRHHANHIFLKFTDPQVTRAFLRSKLSKMLTTAAKQQDNIEAFRENKSKRFRTFANFHLSAAGYAFLEIDADKIPADAQFRAGAKASIARLADPATDDWQKEFREDWHALVIIANASKNHTAARTRSFLKLLGNAGILAESHTEKGAGIKNKAGDAIEHFGYVDGISQPQLLSDKVEDGKITTENWNPLTPLSSALIRDPGGKDENALGSYFVFRKLEQNVKAFHEAEKALAEQLNISVEHAGAQMVGRFKSGVPLTLVRPPQPYPTQANDFDYREDSGRGSMCPFHAHIRKTNPREKESDRRHLFVRRGITYGKDFTRSREQPTAGVGLLFMCHNSDISSQFEFMQRSWSNNVNFPFSRDNSPHGIDPIIGQGADDEGQNYFTKWNDDATETRLPAVGRFVTMQGAEYFFTPSISFLKSL